MQLQMKLLTASDQEKAELTDVLRNARDYHLRLTGTIPTDAEAINAFSALPTGKTYEDKFVVGFYLGSLMVGCADVIRAYPDPETAFIGLLLFRDSHQKLGLGSQAYASLEAMIQEWPSIRKIRLATVSTHPDAEIFWNKKGFSPTGERLPHVAGEIQGEKILFEKHLAPHRPSRERYWMDRSAAEAEDPGNLFDVREVSSKDSHELALLMDEAYRGTIDQEFTDVQGCLDEMLALFSGRYGELIPEASLVTFRDGVLIGACLITRLKSTPLLAYSMTHPAYQGKGVAGFLIQKALFHLSLLGENRLRLCVTRGNSVAESLYRRLGFVEVQEP